MNYIEYVSNEQLIEMIHAQEALNKKYNGEDWRKSVRLGWAKMAFLTELSEMGDEILPTWAWWKKNIVGTDWNKAKFEFIDVLHFAMLLALYRYDVAQLELWIPKEHNQADMYGPVGDPHDQFIRAVTRFLRAVDQENRSEVVIGLRNIIQTGAILVGMQRGEVYRAYQLKNKLNQERVAGGIMEGKYDKANERELTL